MTQKLVERIKEHEGFVGYAYKDSEGFDTIGFGTKLPLSEEESAYLLEMRLRSKIKELEAREPFINKLPLDKQEIIAEMCYQLGVGGVLKFKKMWRALKEFDYETASKEMIDSRWYVQTPNRANHLSEMMRG